MNNRRYEPSLLLPWLLLLKLLHLMVLSHLTVSWNHCGRVSDSTEERWISDKHLSSFCFVRKLSASCKDHGNYNSYLCCFLFFPFGFLQKSRVYLSNFVLYLLSREQALCLFSHSNAKKWQMSVHEVYPGFSVKFEVDSWFNQLFERIFPFFREKSNWLEWSKANT